MTHDELRLSDAQQLYTECVEQARLLGISGERELALLARIGELEKSLRSARREP